MGLMTEDGFPRKGRLEFIDNALDARSGTIEGRAVFDNADGALTPGLFARVRLMSSNTQPAALVPEEALGADLGKHYVLVLDHTNHVQYRAVTLGPALGQLHVVRAGLQPGDQVVTEGLTKVKPGDAVTPTRAQPPVVTASADPGAPGA
jgi:multidrug efflux system membrane fusion protein